MICKALNGKIVGRGSGPIDVVIGNIGIDSTCLSIGIKSNITNEKSITQKFAGNASSFDLMFKEKKYNEIVDIFNETLKNKYASDVIKQMYIVIFISDTKSVRIVVYKICVDNIDNISFDSITKDKNQ